MQCAIKPLSVPASCSVAASQPVRLLKASGSCSPCHALSLLCALKQLVMKPMQPQARPGLRGHQDKFHPLLGHPLTRPRDAGRHTAASAGSCTTSPPCAAPIRRTQRSWSGCAAAERRCRPAPRFETHVALTLMADAAEYANMSQNLPTTAAPIMSVATFLLDFTTMLLSLVRTGLLPLRECEAVRHAASPATSTEVPTRRSGPADRAG